MYQYHVSLILSSCDDICTGNIPIVRSSFLNAHPRAPPPDIDMMQNLEIQREKIYHKKQM
jgi:hypothetical protein